MLELSKEEKVIDIINRIDLWVNNSKTLTITNLEECGLAGSYIKEISLIEKELEIIRKNSVKPFSDIVKEINDYCKGLNIYSAEQGRLKFEMNNVVKEIKRLQDEERLQEQKELEEQLLREAETDESVLDNLPTIEIKRAKPEFENITTARQKKWKIINRELIPREYLIVDEVKLNAKRREFDFEDKSTIEGIEFYYEENIRVK